jgi:hypothetical protein
MAIGLGASRLADADAAVRAGDIFEMAASGRVAAPPSPEMNSRRRISLALVNRAYRGDGREGTGHREARAADGRRRFVHGGQDHGRQGRRGERARGGLLRGGLGPADPARRLDGAISTLSGPAGTGPTLTAPACGWRTYSITVLRNSGFLARSK